MYRGRGARVKSSTCPSVKRSSPAQAIIAALSVHSDSGGATNSNPSVLATLSRLDRTARLAATSSPETKLRHMRLESPRTDPLDPVRSPHRLHEDDPISPAMPSSIRKKKNHTLSDPAMHVESQIALHRPILPCVPPQDRRETRDPLASRFCRRLLPAHHPASCRAVDTIPRSRQ